VGYESVVAPESEVALAQMVGAPGWECEGIVFADLEVLAAAKGKEEGEEDELVEDSGGVGFRGDGGDCLDEIEWDG
jgi:hypothetical protein